MTKGSYNCAPTSEPDGEVGLKPSDLAQLKKDNSYKVMVCNLLVFIVICVILIIIAFPYKFRSKTTHHYPNSDSKSFEKMYGNPQVPQETSTFPIHQDPQATYSESKVITKETSKIFYEIPARTIKEKISTGISINENPSTSLVDIIKSGPTSITNLPQETTTEMIDEEGKNFSDEKDDDYHFWVDESTIGFSTTTVLPDNYPTDRINQVDSNWTDDKNEMLSHENVTSWKDLVETIEPETEPKTEIVYEWITDSKETRSTEATTTTKRSFAKRGRNVASKTSLKYVQEENLISNTEFVPTTTEVVTEPKTNKESYATEISTNENENSLFLIENKASSIKDLPLFGEHKSLNSQVCQDIECKFTSARILAKINHVADPCEDFYDYACGNYNNDNAEEVVFKRIIKEIDGSNEKSPRYLKDFKLFYENCVHFHENFDYQQRVSTAKEIFYSVSKLYEPEENLPHEMNTTELIYKLLSLNFAPIFDINVDIDKRTKNFVFQINLGKLNFDKQKQNCFTKEMKKYVNSSNINLTKVHFNYIKCQHNVSDYLDSVDKALENFDVFPKLNGEAKMKVLHSLRNIIEYDILSSLKELPSPAKVRHAIIKKKYSVIKLSDLEAKYPFIQWCKLLSKLHGGWMDNRQRIQVYFDKYIVHILKILGEMSSLKRHNALMATFGEHLYATFVQPKNIGNPSKYCLKEAINLLKRESTAMYLNSFKSKSELCSSARTISEIFRDLKSNLSAMISATEWLDSNSEEAIRKKIHKIDIVTEDMLDTFKNDSFMNSINEYYTDNSTYQYQFIELLKRNQKEMFILWNQSSSNLDNIWWHYIPNFYSAPKSLYITGKILVPLHTLLEVPKSLPKYLKLALIDYLIAKEIGRQFDSIGITYPLNSNINSVLTKEGTLTYHEMKTCGTDKYSFELSSNFSGKFYGYKIDAGLSLDERIAEDIALKLMEHTSVENEPLLPFMSNSFSREKTMYLAIAQEHCKQTSMFDFMTELFENEKFSPSLLVRSFLGNSKKFPETFQCKDGSGMHHPNKCGQFPDLVPPDYSEPDYSTTN